MSESQPKADAVATYDELLTGDTFAAITLRQELRSVEPNDLPIFPPTYPMTTYRGRVHMVRDGGYSVQVELPPSADRTKKDDGEEQAGDYNIDRLGDGDQNVCIIDSPQSQANRIEPLFKSTAFKHLVPQIIIKVGNTRVNLLDAGHRAADAVVRLSSLCAEFHNAFGAVRIGNHLPLAIIAPTSHLFGVWDSRGTQVKLPRLIRATIRAYNVKKLTKSAQFGPAADYVLAEAVDESRDDGEGDKNPMSAEGLKYSLAVRKHGGVIVYGNIYRDVTLNLAALRQLEAFGENDEADAGRTLALRRYILGLAFVSLTRPADLNLREGCHLRHVDEKDKFWKVRYRGRDTEFNLTDEDASTFASTATAEFRKTFKPIWRVPKAATETSEDHESSEPTWDPPEAIFEIGVANQFLAIKSKDERDSIRRKGPITADALKAHAAKKDESPLEAVELALKGIRAAFPKKVSTTKAKQQIVSADVFAPVKAALDALTTEAESDAAVVEVCQRVNDALTAGEPNYFRYKAVSDILAAFRKERANVAAGTTSEASEEGSDE